MPKVNSAKRRNSCYNKVKGDLSVKKRKSLLKKEKTECEEKTMEAMKYEDITQPSMRQSGVVRKESCEELTPEKLYALGITKPICLMTIQECVNEMKRLCPRCMITYNLIKKLCDERKIKCTESGTRKYVNLYDLLLFFQ